MKRRKFLQILGLAGGATITGVATFIPRAEVEETVPDYVKFRKNVLKAKVVGEPFNELDPPNKFELQKAFGFGEGDYFSMRGSFPFWKKGQTFVFVDQATGHNQNARYIMSEPTGDGFTNKYGHFIRTSTDRIYYFELI